MSKPSSRGQFATFRPPSSLLNLSGEYQSEDESFRFFKQRNAFSYDTSSSENNTPSLPETRPDTVCPDPVKTLVYIDDYNSIEKIRLSEAESHITVNKRKLHVLAQKSERVFKEVESLANSINMKVNAKKTQRLCVHANRNNVVDSYIKTGEEEIKSTDSLKIVGFHFNSEPNAVFHVCKTIDKFYNKLWTLRFLKKSGLGQNNLLQIYKSIIRSSAEYGSVVYNPLIPEYVSDKLESVQKQAMKVIYGWDVCYQTLLDTGIIEPLKQRRNNASLKFALNGVKL